MLSTLILKYGYLALSIGAFLEGEAVLLSAGALAHAGLLDLPTVVACGLCASALWDQCWFELGQHFDNVLMTWRPAWRERSVQAKRFLCEHPLLFVFAYRFLTGMGALGPSLTGAAGVARRRFTAMSLLGAAVWSLSFTVTGWAVGAGMHRLWKQVEAWQALVGSVLIGLIAFGLIVRLLRRHVRSFVGT